MDEDSKHAHHGLPWPEAYGALRGLIGEQWGIGDDIYLIRQLSGGKSGALVYLADVTGKDFTGQAILKFDQAPDPAWQEKSEAVRHMTAFEAAPDYAERHLPQILHTAHDGESLAILSTVAGRGLEFAMPWSLCDHDRQVNIAKRLSRSLLEDWNRGAKLAPGLQTPQTLLRSWLGYRLDPEQGRLHAALPEICGLAPDEPSFSFEGRWYPNPLAFAVAGQETANHLMLRAVLGHVHGDLHGLNVLVNKTGTEKEHYYLIDLALYEGAQFLFYDHGYFTLSYLLSMRGQASAPHWQSILDELCQFDHMRPSRGLHGDDIGLAHLLKLARQEVLDWVARHQTHRLSYMESQLQLAHVAAGLNFANKPIDDRLRRWAFLYAAALLKDYLSLHDVDWPKHGPPLALEKRTPAPARTAAPAPKAAPPADPGTADPALPEKPAIAVLAFANQGGDPEQEYFADGVTDEIIMELSRVDWLMVISRGSTFSYKGRTVDTKQIGQELGVHYVVDGAVRKAGERVRVTAQLVDAQAGKQLWAERFDRKVSDVFDLQEEIAAAIVANIESRVKAAGREEAGRKTGNVTLWEAFQKAMWHFNKFTEEDAEVAEAQLLGLMEETPSFAGVHAALALLQLRRLFRGDPGNLDHVLKVAYQHATRAVELDEGNSMARIALSRVLSLQGKYDQANQEAEKSIDLNPNSSAGYLNLAATMLWGERAEEAILAVEKSIRLSPKGPLFRLTMLVKGVACYFLDDYGEAERLLRLAEASHVLAPFTRLLLAAVFIRQGRPEEARKAMSEACAMRPQMSASRMNVAWRTMSPRYRDKLVADLERAGLRQ